MTHTSQHLAPISVRHLDPATGESITVIGNEGIGYKYAFLGQTPNDQILEITPITADMLLPVPVAIVRAKEVTLLAAAGVAQSIAQELLDQRLHPVVQ